MWGLTFLAALLTLLLRNIPSSHGKGKHDATAAEPFFDAPKPFSKAYSVVSRQLSAPFSHHACTERARTAAGLCACASELNLLKVAGSGLD